MIAYCSTCALSALILSPFQPERCQWWTCSIFLISPWQSCLNNPLHGIQTQNLAKVASLASLEHREGTGSSQGALWPNLRQVRSVDQNDAPSSIVNSTPPIGVRKAAATPAAVPMAAKSRLPEIVHGEQPKHVLAAVVEKRKSSLMRRDGSGYANFSVETAVSEIGLVPSHGVEIKSIKDTNRTSF